MTKEVKGDLNNFNLSTNKKKKTILVAADTTEINLKVKIFNPKKYKKGTEK